MGRGCALGVGLIKGAEPEGRRMPNGVPGRVMVLCTRHGRRSRTAPGSLYPAEGGDAAHIARFAGKRKGVSGSSSCPVHSYAVQNGFTTTRMTMPAISRVGTSLAM